MAHNIADYELDKQIEWLTSVAMDRSHRANYMYELAGPFDFDSPYQHTLKMIDAAIGRLKLLRAEMQRVASHHHDWNGDDYCSICGADGRA